MCFCSVPHLRVYDVLPVIPVKGPKFISTYSTSFRLLISFYFALFWSIILSALLFPRPNHLNIHSGGKLCCHDNEGCPGLS